MAKRKGNTQNLRPAPPEVQAKAVEAAKEWHKARASRKLAAQEAISYEDLIDLFRAMYFRAVTDGDNVAAMYLIDSLMGKMPTAVVSRDEEGNDTQIGITGVMLLPAKPPRTNEQELENG